MDKCKHKEKPGVECGVSCDNTDKEIFRLYKDDHYSPSVHVTIDGKIGMNIGGFVIVKSIRDWHNMAKGESN